MSWVAVGVAAVGVVGGAISSNQQKKGAQGAANAQERANQLAIEEQRRQFDLTRQDQMPWLNAGSDALRRMQALNSGDFSQFYSSPDYTFALGQGLQGIDRSAAARGAMFSGGADADRMKFASGLASQNYSNFYARLQSMAGQGQTTASGLGTLGMGMAGNIGNSLVNSGNARASSYLSRADANSQFATGTMGALAGLYGNYMGQRQQQQPQGYNGPGWSYTGPTAATYGYTG